jgi:flagellar biogenesis protein FliO
MGLIVMGRMSAALLVTCAVGAFFLPLVVRLVMQTGAETAPAGRAPAGQPAAVASTSTADRISVFGGEPGGSPSSETRRASWIKEASDGAKQKPSLPATHHPLDNINALLVKIALATGVVLTVCVVCLRLGNSIITKRAAGSRELELSDSIAVSRDAGVKLIRIGDQRVVVGHDKNGLQSMVLLPERFESVLNEVQADDRTYAPPVRSEPKPQDQISPASLSSLERAIRKSLRNPEDDGWDLSRPIS